MKDSMLELRGKESFYQSRGVALATFLNQLVSIPIIANSNCILWFLYYKARDEVSKDRIAQIR